VGGVNLSIRVVNQNLKKKRLSHWIVDAISLAYAFVGLQCLIGVRAYSTGGMAASWVWSGGVSVWTSVWRPAGPHRPPSPDFTIWTSLISKHGSCLSKPWPCCTSSWPEPCVCSCPNIFPIGLISHQVYLFC